MYAPRVQILDRKTPTPGLLLGLIVIVGVVIAYSWYTTVQISGLQQLQSEMVDRNRKDSLQLLRIQDDLNSLAHAMRDMLDGGEPYPITAWAPQFERIRADLEDAADRALPGSIQPPDFRRTFQPV
jgi:hypothetical protein